MVKQIPNVTKETIDFLERDCLTIHFNIDYIVLYNINTIIINCEYQLIGFEFINNRPPSISISNITVIKLLAKLLQPDDCLKLHWNDERELKLNLVIYRKNKLFASIPIQP